MHIFIHIAVLRKVLRTCKDYIRIAEIDVVRTFVYAVELEVILVESRRAIDQLAQILPVIEISGTEQDHVTVAVGRLDCEFRHASRNRAVGIEFHGWVSAAHISQICRIASASLIRFIRVNDSCAGKAVEPSVLAERFRITEIAFCHLIGKLFRAKNRIVGNFFESYTPIGRDGIALSLAIRLSSCVHEIQFIIDRDCVAGAASADLFIILIRHKSYGQFFPFDKIVCHIVSPVHGSP